MLGKIEGRRRRGRQRLRWWDGIIDSMDMNLSQLQKIVEGEVAGVLQSMVSQVRLDSVSEQQQVPLLIWGRVVAVTPSSLGL